MNILIYKKVGIGLLYKIAVANKNRDIKYYIKRKLLPASFNSKRTAEVIRIKKKVSDVAEVYAKKRNPKPKRIPLTQIAMRFDKLQHIIDQISSDLLHPYERDNIDFDCIKLKAQYLYSTLKIYRDKFKRKRFKIEN